jgi:dTDP-4-amino-4,6-dideoxygalactose transaminase
MMALGLKPGDEVIAPSFTFIATAEVIALLGLTPVLVDVEPDTFNVNPDAITKAITPRTKAIVPVHLFGQSANMDAIMNIARQHNLFVIEDACQSIGSDYLNDEGEWHKSGTISHVGCTSFFPSKNLGCYGDGGAIFTNDDLLAAKIRSIVNHGMTVRYYHDEIGVNSRLDSIQAAVLKVKLKYLDKYAQARQKLAAAYTKAFRDQPGLIIPAIYTRSTHVFHQYTLQAVGFDRARLIEYLASKEIPAMIYYPVPIHLQKAYLDPRYKEGDFPVTEKLCATVFSLPMHTEMDQEQQNHIINSVLEFLKS